MTGFSWLRIGSSSGESFEQLTNYLFSAVCSYYIIIIHRHYYTKVDCPITKPSLFCPRLSAPFELHPLFPYCLLYIFLTLFPCHFYSFKWSFIENLFLKEEPCCHPYIPHIHSTVSLMWPTSVTSFCFQILSHVHSGFLPSSFLTTPYKLLCLCMYSAYILAHIQLSATCVKTDNMLYVI